MTDKEAIIHLHKEVESIPSDCYDEGTEKFAEAVEVATKALNWRDHQQHGYWKDDGTCSVCGMSANYTKNGWVDKSNFCPQCGRQMYDIAVIEYKVRRCIPRCDEERTIDT